MFFCKRKMEFDIYFKCVFFKIYVLMSAHLHLHSAWWCESCGRCSELCSFIFSSFLFSHLYFSRVLVPSLFRLVFFLLWEMFKFMSILLPLFQWLCIWFNWHFTLSNETFAFLVQIHLRPIFSFYSSSSSSTSIFTISHSSKIERISVSFFLHCG